MSENLLLYNAIPYDTLGISSWVATILVDVFTHKRKSSQIQKI